jgi:signal transduction histidine kinase
MMSTALLAALVVTPIGILLLWANPGRRVNRAVFASSLTVAAWLVCKHLAATRDEYGLFWLRCSHAIGGLAPLSLWIVKEGINDTFRPRSLHWLRGSMGWLLSAVLLFALPFSELFIPSSSTEAERLRGIGFYAYYAGVVTLYGRLFYDSITAVKKASGVRKMELQVWLCGGCIVAVAIYILIGLGYWSGSPVYRALQPIAVLLFYAGTAYAITSHRIFDARQIILLVTEKVALVSAAGSAAYAGSWILALNPSDPLTFLFTTLIALTTAGLLHRWLGRQFRFLPKGDEARQAAFAAAQRETRTDKLENAFRSLLASWGQTEHALIIYGTRSTLLGGGLQLDMDGELVATMRTLRWATPERIARERATPARSTVGQFLNENQLGLLVFEEGAALTVLLGVAIGASRRPYTYPEVRQLLEFAAIMQAALERTHYSGKAQQAEQLATVGLMGASLAHEIRNPLVSIKTFIQLLPNHYQDPKFRNKFFRLISDEVGRIDQLTEQLLDLATPRAYAAEEIDLHPLLASSIELVAAKASHRKIEMVTELRASPDRAFTDASAAKQVMLNLLFNAIQAVEQSEKTDKWVKVSTRNVQSGIELVIADNGPGIAPEIRPKLFQPFQTTKSTGFGLGLAICSDILANLAATISIDPSEPGKGAIFRVTFPCRPTSS